MPSVYLLPLPLLRVVMTGGALSLALCHAVEATPAASVLTGSDATHDVAPQVTMSLPLPGSPSSDATASSVQRQRDSLWNGILIGAGVGAVVGLAVVPRTYCGNDTECRAIVTLAIGVPIVAGGAGIGALVDALRHERREKPRRFDVAPVVGRGMRGVQVQWNMSR
jgi:hypothetical protein